MRLFCFTQISVDVYLETEPNLHKRLQVHAQFFDKRESILDKSLHFGDLENKLDFRQYAF